MLVLSAYGGEMSETLTGRNLMALPTSYAAE